MGTTRDRSAGPLDEEEIQLEDRTSDGDPTTTGAIRRIGDYIRFKAASFVEQVLTARNYPAGFDGLDLSGVNDGDSITYELSSKTLKPAAVGGPVTDRAWRRHFLTMGG